VERGEQGAGGIALALDELFQRVFVEIELAAQRPQRDGRCWWDEAQGTTISPASASVAKAESSA